jgi:hypothetical protein
MLEALRQFRHRRFRRDLSAYLDNMLSERARRRLEAHLDSCQACRQELAELRVTIGALGSLPMAEAPRSFALAAAPVAEVSPRPTARRLEFGLRLATATAAFALALVVIGDFAGLPGGGEEEEGEMAGMLFSAVEETQEAMEVAPVETPAPLVPGITETYRQAPEVGADVSEGEPAEKEVMEGAEVEEEAEAGAAEAQAVAEDEGGGLSREEAVRWLEIGLGAGIGILVIVWAFARFQRSIGNRS